MVSDLKQHVFVSSEETRPFYWALLKYMVIEWGGGKSYDIVLLIIIATMYLHSIYCVLGTVLVLMTSTSPISCSYDFHFTGKEGETQRSTFTHLWAPSL